MKPWLIPGKEVPVSQGHLQAVMGGGVDEGLGHQPASVEGGKCLNPGMQNQESGHARGPFREPRGSRPLGCEKCHLFKGASRGREERVRLWTGRLVHCLAVPRSGSGGD